MSHVDPFGLERASAGTKDIVRHTENSWSGTASDGSVEVGTGNPFESSAGGAWENGLAAVDRAAQGWSFDPSGAMGTHLPLGGGNYVTPAEVHNAVQNVAREVLIDSADTLRIHHLVKGFTGWDPTARVRIGPKSDDPKNRSEIVGTIIGVAGVVAIGGAGGAETGAEAAAGGAENLAARFDPSRAGHIFRNAAGHVSPASAGSQARFARLFERVASNQANLRADAVQANLITQQAADAGVQAFTWTGRTGQVWVTARNGIIQNAGINRLGAFR